MPVATIAISIVGLVVLSSSGLQDCKAQNYQPQPMGSLGDTVSGFEQRVGIPFSPNRSLVDRLATLEQRVFGNARGGSLMERIDGIKRYIDQPGTAQPQFQQQSQQTPQQLLQLPPPQYQQAPPPQAAPSEPPPQQQAPTRKETASPQPIAQVMNSQGPLNNEEIKQLANALPSVNVMPPRFYRIETAEQAETPAGNYLPAILKATSQKVMRFKVMPVPVYITPFTNPLYTQACIQGFESWENRTNGLIRFAQVKDPNQARIRVIWSSLGMSTDANNCALGAHTVTKWKKKPPGTVTMLNVGSIPVPLYLPRLGPKYQVPAQIIEVNIDLIASKNEEIRYIVLKNIVTHELGHALGLLGHSPDRSDMMFDVTDENSRISRRDIETLSKIYEMKIDIGL